MTSPLLNHYDKSLAMKKWFAADIGRTNRALITGADIK
jgi:hypothetical protein